MKNFNLQRFGRVLRLDFVEGRSQLLWQTFAGLMVYLFFFWFAYNIGMTSVTVDNWEWYINGVCEGVGMFGCVAMYLFFLAVASSLFRKEQRKANTRQDRFIPPTSCCVARFKLSQHKCFKILPLHRTSAGLVINSKVRPLVSAFHWVT